MKISIRLADADRQRFGCDEWLPLDLDSVTGREAAVMQRGYDLDGEWVSFADPGIWAEAAFKGTVVTGPDGQPVMVDVVSDDGQTRQEPKRRPNWGAQILTVWLALRRADIRMPLAEVDFHLGGLSLRVEPDPDEPPPGDESPGKDAASTPSTTSTD